MHTFQIGWKVVETPIFEVITIGDVLGIFFCFSFLFQFLWFFRISHDSSWIFIRPSGFGLWSWQFPPLHPKGNQNLRFSAPGFAFDFAPAPESFFMLHVRSYWKSAYFPNWLESCGNSNFWSYCDCRCFSIFPFFSVFFSVFVIFRISRDSSWIFIRPSGFGLESWQFPPLHLKVNQNHRFSAPGFAFDFVPAPESFFMLHVRSY